MACSALIRRSVNALGGGNCGPAPGFGVGARAAPPPARSPKAPSARTKASAAPVPTRASMASALARVARGRRVLGLDALELRVEPGVRRCDVRERGPERHVVCVHPVAQRQLVALQEAADDAQADVD